MTRLGLNSPRGGERLTSKNLQHFSPLPLGRVVSNVYTETTRMHCLPALPFKTPGGCLEREKARNINSLISYKPFIRNINSLISYKPFIRNINPLVSYKHLERFCHLDYGPLPSICPHIPLTNYLMILKTQTASSRLHNSSDIMRCALDHLPPLTGG